MKITAEPRSDQWNSDDFIGSSRTFTIAGVKEGRAEAKYDIDLVEGEGRCWRPPLTILRLLIAVWGDEASVWIGRRVTLYCDPSIRFGPDQVGGIRVSHMSALPGGKSLTVKITSARGRKSPHTVEPLTEPTPTAAQMNVPTPETVAACTDTAELGAMWKAHPQMRAQIEARVAEIKAGAVA